MAKDDDDEYEHVRRSSIPVELPSMEAIIPEPTDVKSPPEVIQSLYGLNDMMQILRMDAVTYYEMLQLTEDTLSDEVAPRGHVDGGSRVTTTSRKEYLWGYRPASEAEREMLPSLQVADGTKHKPSGHGYIKIPARYPHGHMYVPAYYTPEIPATIVSPDSMGKAYACQGYMTFSDFQGNASILELNKCGDTSETIKIDLERIRGLLFTDALVMPTNSEHVQAAPTDAPMGIETSIPHTRGNTTEPYDVQALSMEDQRKLWHMRLGHVNERMVSDLHKYNDGIPSLPRSDPLHKCPICARTKIHKANRGAVEEREPEKCWKDIQVDYGFFVQKSAGRKAKNSVVRTSEIHAVTTRRQARAEGTQHEHEPTNSEATTSDETVTKPPNEEQPSDNDDVTLSNPTKDAYNFEKILTHEGPLARSHKRYKGGKYNLKIQWTNGERTWEPYHLIHEDAPAEVHEYARLKNLLGNPDWTFVRDHVIPEPRPDRDTHEDETEMQDDHAEERVIPGMSAEEVAQKNESATRRYNRLMGIHGETCYVMITCMYSGACKIAIRRDKTPPLDFFEEFIARYTPDIQNKRVRMDNGGELGGCTEVHDLFEKAGYTVELTSPNDSSSIGGVERPHRTIADAVRTMLYAAGLEAKFWPYALKYWNFMNDFIPHGDRDAPPKEICTGTRGNVSRLRVFGCRVYVMPPRARESKVEVHTRTGIFLGYHRSMKKAYYYDLESKQVKTARHIVFDEGMQDLDDPPPYVRYLKGEMEQEAMDMQDSTEAMEVILTPFTRVKEITIPIRPRSVDALGMRLEKCPRYLRGYVSEITRDLGDIKRDAANRQYVGSYILKIGDTYTYTPTDVERVVENYRKMDKPPSTITIRLAVDQKADLADDRRAPLQLRAFDIRRIAAMMHTTGEGKTSKEQREEIRRMANQPMPMHRILDDDEDVVTRLTPDEVMTVHSMVNEHMTPEERNLKSFTRKNLMKLSNWEEWRAADFKQLDNHFKSGTMGKAVIRPNFGPDQWSTIFNLVWRRVVKPDGTRKSRSCLDGSKRAAAWLRALVQTYSSCLELPCQRIFVAMCARRGLNIYYGDVDNAFQQAPPPTFQCYIAVDATVADWYESRFGIKLDPSKHVIPLYKALQGFPEAGALWEKMIQKILLVKMGFKCTVHERNLYIGTINGQEVLVARQVDDFAIGAKNKETAQSFIDALREHVNVEFDGMGKRTDSGVHERFNGMEITQTRDYIKIGCETYIDRMMETHGWDKPPQRETKFPVPIVPSLAERLHKVEGPKEKTAEARALESKHGFSYRNLLGELMYAYVICRVDIGYAICLLARFSTNPGDEHFHALRAVTKYLRHTKSWGLIYQRPEPIDELPSVPFPYINTDPTLPPYPKVDPDRLTGILDAAHATDLRTRRSTTGIMIFYGGAVIAYKSRLQSLTATSSTEAEFYAAVLCAKLIKYYRYVLQELGVLGKEASELFVDNEAAINMINERRPTPRARHVDIQHFAIQEWRDAGDIVMKHIPGTINPSDGMTKALSHALHERHARRGMGHYSTVSDLDSDPQRGSKPGRVLEPTIGKPSFLTRETSRAADLARITMTGSAHSARPERIEN